MIKLVFNLSNYSKEAIYGAAYVFLDRAYLFLDSPSAKKIEVFLKGKRKLNAKQKQNLKGEFMNELLNYTVRVNLAKKNKKIRDLIIGEALLSAIQGEQNQESQEEEVNYQEDPLGIAVPWEEKYGKTTASKKKK